MRERERDGYIGAWRERGSVEKGEIWAREIEIFSRLGFESIVLRKCEERGLKVHFCPWLMNSLFPNDIGTDECYTDRHARPILDPIRMI